MTVPRSARAFAIAVCISVVASCGTAQVAPTARPTPNINRSRLDLAYTAIADQDRHRVSSKTLLTAALAAVRLQATSTGGTVDPVTPSFTDVSEDVPADFKLFAQIVEGIAAANPQLSASLISDSAIEAMVKATPDCYTVYSKTSTDVPVAAGLQWRLLGGNVGYVAWHAFIKDSSYDIQVEVRKALDTLLAQGARAWLFDWRDSPSGGQMGTMAEWFLNGEPMYVRAGRTGAPTTVSAHTAVRLPAAYQLPIAVLMNRRSIAASEGIAVAWRENHRATIIGAKGPGCVGTARVLPLPGGGVLVVAIEEFVGAVTGTHYANVGVEPDIVSDDATAIDVATKLLQSKVAP